MRRHVILVPALVLLNMASAVAVVMAKHASRELLNELQVLRVEQDEMQVSWAQLRLEESALANYDRVNRLARREMDMYLPEHYIVLERQP